MKKYRILVLVHEDLIPPDSLDGFEDAEIIDWKTEFDVVTTLRELGHEVLVVGVRDDLGVIRRAILEFKPHITFNLLEEFHGKSLYDHHVASYLELMEQPYTGCNPRGLLLSHDKALSKKILSFHRLRTPRFIVFPRGAKPRVPKRLQYPFIVKSLVEEGSYGISQASIVRTEDKLIERVQYLQEKLETPVIVEEFIEGRELYVAVMGNHRLQVLPILELQFGNMPEGTAHIATSRVKWDWKYQEQRQIELIVADNLDDALRKRITQLGKRIYRALNLSGYARVDLRLTDTNEIYVLEANANPDIGFGEELSTAAEAANIDYPALIQRVINLGLRYEGIPSF